MVNDELNELNELPETGIKSLRILYNQ